MNYEIQQAISRKADEWEVHALKSQISELKSEIRQLTENINYAKNRMENQYRAIDTLIQLIIEKDLLPENTNQLYELKNYL
jgi:predicted  nucleic acid-binding Zn-ribbon protein